MSYMWIVLLAHDTLNQKGNSEKKKGKAKPYQARFQEEWHLELLVKRISLNMPSALSPPPTQSQSEAKCTNTLRMLSRA